MPNESSELTMPLLLPKISSRTQGGSAITTTTNINVEPSPSTSPTIPLKLSKPKTKASSALQSTTDNALSEKPTTQTVNNSSVLSSLTEEDLIRKAAEMLGESDNDAQTKKIKDQPTYQPTPSSSSYISPLQTSNIFNQPPPNSNTPSTLLNTPPTLLNTPPPPQLLITTCVNTGTVANLITTQSSTMQTNVVPSSTMNLNNLPAKRSKIDLNQPPIPGLEDET